MLVQERLNRLRELMKQHDMDAYIIVTDDYHGSEYVGDYFKEREFMSGFTGSALMFGLFSHISSTRS